MKTMKMKATIECFLEATKLGMPYTGRGSSEKTLTTYGESLRRVERLVGKPLAQFDPTCGQTFLRNTDGLGVATVNASIVAAKGFFRWAIGNKLFKGENPFEHIRTKTIERKLPVILDSRDEVERLLDAIESEKYSLFFRVMFYGGLRMEEVLTLRKDALRENGVLIKGKGAKERFVPLNEDVLNRLRLYIASHDKTDYVFYAESGKQGNQPMKSYTAREAFTAGLKAAGLPETLTPHKLRHTFATQLLEATGRIEVVQKVLGHSNPATTLIYAQVRDSALAAEYQKAFA